MRKMSVIPTMAAAAALASFALLSGCGGGSPDAGAQEPADHTGGLDRCALLTDDEVEMAVGGHDGGKTGLENTWGLGSCRWKATAAQVMEAYPDGWFDAIEVGVFDEEPVKSWARQEAEGEPVDGFVQGALYDSTWGQLWFNCAGDRFCVVFVSTASGDKREQVAVRLARLVESRLR